jgi:alanyl-tRNA synthetase
VQTDGALVWHVLEQDAAIAELPIGAGVQAVIDPERRFDHMQQHCGQHLLSAAFVEQAGLVTVGFHLSDNNLTIDLAGEVSTAQITAAEERANRIIWENRPIHARFVSTAELARLPLRKQPGINGPVRVVSIADFDHSACGGTHPTQTGAVGVLVVIGWERRRNGSRLAFACGKRAQQAYRRIDHVANAAATALSIAIDELPVAVERLLGVQRTQSKALEQTRAELDQQTALALYAAAADGIVCHELPALTAERLRSIARTIAAQPGGIAMLGSRNDDRAHLVVACAPDRNRDARAILQAGLAVIGGRGGGSRTMAQGGGDNSIGITPALDAMRALAQG